MKFYKLKLIALTVGLGLNLSAIAADISLLNVSYDPTRELYQDFNTAFANAVHMSWIFTSKRKLGLYEAKINHIYAVGPIVRVELAQKNKGIIEAELTKEEFKKLVLVSGQSVYLNTKNVQLFSLAT